MRKIRVLVGCEESQEVTIALRNRGIEAYSCDLVHCTGWRPEWHIQDDVRIVVRSIIWDAVIAFPPCTHLCASGARWWAEKKKNGKQEKAVEFFKFFTELDIEHVAIENPVGIMSRIWRKPDQIIQPYQFGHQELKTTCLWLKGLPLLTPTNIVDRGRNRLHALPPSSRRSELRSKTYPGIAMAMAEQWGDYLIEKYI